MGRRWCIVILNVVCYFTICTEAVAIIDSDFQNADNANQDPAPFDDHTAANEDIASIVRMNKRFNNIVFTPNDYQPVGLLQKMLQNENVYRPRKLDAEFGGMSGGGSAGRRMRFGGAGGKSMSHLTDLLNTGVTYGIRWGRRRRSA